VSEPATRPEERHASWAELFFDLVAVAGVAMYAHLLHDATWQSMGLFAIGFGAFWTSWTSYMLFSSASGEASTPNRLLQAMFGLAVMAAAVPGVAEAFVHSTAEHGAEVAESAERPIQVTVFAVAYVATRWITAGSWRRGDVLLDWPLAQSMTGAIPWVASIWAPLDWVLWLWTAGLLIDLLTLVFRSGEDIQDSYETRLAHVQERVPERELGPLTWVSLDTSHLSERLGLFIIIVLGEGVIQSVDAASEATWDWALFGTGAAALTLLGGLWRLSVLHGHAGVPLLQRGVLPRRLELGLHGPTAASLVLIAAAVGSLVGSGSDRPDTATRWVLFGGLAAYFGIGAIASLLAGRLGVTRLIVWLASGVAVPLLLAEFAGRQIGVTLAWYAAAVVLLHSLGSRRHGEDRAVSPA